MKYNYWLKWTLYCAAGELTGIAVAGLIAFAANRLIGDHNLPENKQLTKTTAPYRLEGKPLLKAGLLGPVRIVVERK